MLAQVLPMWELSNMAEENDSRGQALHDKLMALKPASLAPTKWALEAGLNRGFFTNLKGKKGSVRSDSLRKLLEYIGKTEADLVGADLDLVPETNARAIHFEGAGLEKT